MSVWTELSAINVNDHTEKKGKFTYLAWTFAWASVVEKYPDAVYQVLDDKVFADGSMEVRTEVSIDGKTLPMWLCVTDFSNKAIQHPNAFDINTARMRCLTKNLAMHGLGFYLYAGESAPQEPGLSDEEFDELVRLLADKEGITLVRYMAELGDSKSAEAFNRAPKGQKTQFKDSVRDTLKLGHAQIDTYVTELDRHANNNDPSGVLEITEELSQDSWLKAQVWGRLTDIQKHQIKTILEEAA